MPLHAIMVDLLKHHLNNVEYQFMSKRNSPLSLANVLCFEINTKNRRGCWSFLTRCLNTLSGNGHNYICSA